MEKNFKIFIIFLQTKFQLIFLVLKNKKKQRWKQAEKNKKYLITSKDKIMARIRKILLAVFLLCNISAIGQVSIKDYEHDENWHVLPEDQMEFTI